MPSIELLNAGANVAIATDGTAPYASYDLSKIPRALWEQWIRFKDLSCSPRKVLRMVTIDAARALGMDDLVGSLEVGKRADIILVDMDQPHLTPVHAAAPAGILRRRYGCRHGDCGRHVVMEGRKVNTVDMASVVELAREEISDRVRTVRHQTVSRPWTLSFWQVGKG